MNNLAVAYKDQGKYEQAEPLLTKALETQQRLQGKESQGALDTLENLAALYRTQGRSQEAVALCTKLLENRRRVLGAEHPGTLLTMTNLALIYQRQARFGEAEALLIKVLEVRRRVLPPPHNDTTATLARLGEVRYQQRKYEEAEPLLREALSTYQKTLPDDWRLYKTQCLLGADLAGQEKYADGEPVLIAGYEGLLRWQASIPAEWRADLERARQWIVALYRDWGKPEQAAEWREKIQVGRVEPR
jgi:tetratricopeptide (TPR) repeat protein